MFASPLSWIARAAAACAAALTLASCGGGVSANPSPIVDSPTLTILPATATMYSGLPTTFVLSGGTGAYILTSNNQAILPIAGGVTGRSVTLVPNPVAADTTVTLTLRDTGSASPVSATVTVRPGTVNNDITITPSSTQAASCSPAICSGSDATVTVTISQGGIPLAARGIRFTAVSGSYSFVPLGSGVVEQAGAAFVTTTDETGKARAKIFVTALAPNQTALLQVTDMASGAYRQTSFAIAQYTGDNPAFFTLPSTITFTGPYANVCASGASTYVSVFGGTPPYNIAGQTSAFYITGSPVSSSGGSFRIALADVSPPICIESAVIGVTDSAGRTITVTLSNVAGTGAAPPPAIAVAPASLELRCSFSIPNPGTPPPATVVVAVTSSFTVTGGTPPFSVSSNHPRILVTANERTVTVQRLNGDLGVLYPSAATITVTDGNTSASVSATIVDGATPPAPVRTCP